MGQSSSNKEVFKVGALKLGLQQMFNNAEPGKLTNWNSIDYGWKSRTAIISGYERRWLFVEESKVGLLLYVLGFPHSLIESQMVDWDDDLFC